MTQGLGPIFKGRGDMPAVPQRGREVARRSQLSKDEFYSTYYASSEPVILVDWFEEYAARECWQPECLIAAFGDESVEVMGERHGDPLYERNYDAHRRTLLFGDFVNRAFKSGPSNDRYLVANNQLLKRETFKALLHDLPSPPFLNPELWDGRSFLWLGPAGTITPLHQDDCNVLFVQVSGRKSITLIPPEFTPFLYNRVGCYSDVDAENPDLARYPEFAKAVALNVIVQPGEALFIPVLWWHHVKALDASISLSLTNFIYPNNFRILRPDWCGTK